MSPTNPSTPPTPAQPTPPTPAQPTPPTPAQPPTPVTPPLPPSAGKQFANKPAAGPVETAISKIADAQARRIQHNKLIADAVTNFPEFTLGKLRVVPTSPVHIDQETKMVEIRCFVFDALTGQEIEHPDGRFQFDQPPFHIHDGTWRKEGDLVRPNMKEDVTEALKIALVKAILIWANRPIPVSLTPPVSSPRYATNQMGFRITTSGKLIRPPEINGRWAPYGDPPPGETWKEIA